MNGVLPGALRVLVVEDDPNIRRVLRLFLEREGYHVMAAENGAVALKLYQHFRPDLVLMDLMMPVMDGFTACAHLRRLPGGDQTPVLAVTALDDGHSIDQALAAGVTDVITKPIQFAVLRQRMKELAAAHALELLNP